MWHAYDAQKKILTNEEDIAENYAVYDNSQRHKYYENIPLLY